MSAPSSEGTHARLDRPIPFESPAPIGDWRWAQDRTNFVVVVPTASSGWAVASPTVRGESPNAYSTVRYFLDRDGFRLRVKQYFHDWWIPTMVDISFRRPGRPLMVGESVVFVGRDYRRNDAACGHRWGTGVEMSLEKGALSDEEWRGLWACLDAAVPDAVRQARGSSFAARGYWNRWGRTEAPWNTRELSSLRWHPPTTEAMASSAWALTADRWAGVPGVIDSIGIGRDEAQFVFRWPLDLNVSAWMRVLRAVGDDWRPLIDASEVNRPSWRRTEIAGREAEIACMDRAVGNWFLAWREGSTAYELHLRARAGLDEAAALRVVRSLLS